MGVVLRIVVAVIGIALILMAFYLAPRLTGFAVHEPAAEATPDTNYLDSISSTLADSQEMVWAPVYGCSLENCTLHAVRLSGSIETARSGEVTISLWDGEREYAILQETILLETQEIAQEVLIEENVTRINESTHESYTEIVQRIEESLYTVEIPATFVFEQSCAESCIGLELAPRPDYTLRVSAPANTSIIIEEVIYSWTIERQIAVELTNDSISTNITVIPQNSTVINITYLSLTNLTSLDMSPRENSTLPAHWYLKSEVSLTDADSGQWEWNPLERPGWLKLSLDSMKRPQAEYTSQELRVFSQTITVPENSTVQLSFNYRVSTSACLQFGMDSYTQQGSSLTSYFISLDENATSSDFMLETVREVEGVTVQASVLASEHTQLQFYYKALCDIGTAELTNFTYTFINY